MFIYKVFIILSSIQTQFTRMTKQKHAADEKDICISAKRHATRSKELPVELRDKIVSRHKPMQMEKIVNSENLDQNPDVRL